MIPQLKSIFNKNQWVQIQNWVNGRLSLKQNIFDASNTASGTTSVTINATSGVATFTTVIPYESTASLVINNTNITTDSIVQLSLKSNSTGAPTITKYSTSSGVLAINVLNVADGNGDPTDDDLIISFQILS